MSLSSLKNRAAAQNGFSLIELLVVVLIIGILAAIMIPRFLGQRDNANNSQAQTTVRNAASAAEAFYQKNGEAYGTAAQLADEIDQKEPAIGITGGAATPTTPVGANAGAAIAGNAANPKNVWLVTTNPTSREGTATICAASKGDRAYCMILRGNDETQYGADGDVGAAQTEAAAGAPGNWNG